MITIKQDIDTKYVYDCEKLTDVNGHKLIDVKTYYYDAASNHAPEQYTNYITNGFIDDTIVFDLNSCHIHMKYKLPTPTSPAQLYKMVTHVTDELLRTTYYAWWLQVEPNQKPEIKPAYILG